jgi:hypothetical protein
MTKIPSGLLIKSAGSILCLLFTLSACTILGGGVQQATPTPLPTSIVSDMQVIAPQACLVAKQRMIRVEVPQGDLIAWSPKDETVAYIAATSGSSWNVGELNLLSAPNFDAPVRMATGVAGELTWSPDASAIAYLGLRRSDNLYTIGLAYPISRTSQDLFPDEAARTDDYSSQKTILKWMDSSRLRVLVSCGNDCMQTLDIAVKTGLSSSVADPIQRTWDMWSVHTFQPSVIPPEIAKLSGQLNWSRDEQHIAYIDNAGNAWVINVNDHNLYPLEIGQYSTATETGWSFDNQYLAVQVDQQLMIFSFQCP